MIRQNSLVNFKEFLDILNDLELNCNNSRAIFSELNRTIQEIQFFVQKKISRQF